MHKIVFLGAMTIAFFIALDAQAYFWECSGGWTATRLDGRGKFTTSKATVSLSAPTENDAINTAKKKFAERADLNVYKDPVGFVDDCKRKVPKTQPPEPAPVPLPVPIVPLKPASRDWVCRVKLRWHLDARSKDVDETITIDDATGKTDAEGKAIYRIQQRQRALFRDADGRRMTFSQTTVTCT